MDPAALTALRGSAALGAGEFDVSRTGMRFAPDRSMQEQEAPTQRQPGETSRLESTPCAVCGNVYDKAFEIRSGGRSFTFDCLECAIHQLAPECAHCHCRVIGHGTESDGVVFCCAHCARSAGATSARDRVDSH
ncbi:MAG TPA: hypothetical protein VJU61_04820 [Polyangiaceae bacterium]|nr:hypothetical protein [Polyangiaceae bacterium]